MHSSRPITAALAALLAISACDEVAEAPRSAPPPVSRQSLDIVPADGCQETFTPIEDPATGVKPGYAGLFNTETQLVFRLVAEGSWVPGSWVLESASIYAGTGPVPTDGAGLVDPTLFPVQVTIGSPSRRVFVPLPAECNATLNIAVFVRFYRDGAAGRETITGWAGGVEWPNSTNPGWIFGIPFAGQDGWYVQNRICCAVVGCTLTQGYWKNHADSWPTDTLTLGGVSYTKAQLLTLLRTPVRGDASVNLAHQLIASLLNLHSVTSPPAEVSADIAAAQAWLSAHADADGRLPFRVRAGSAAGAAGVELASDLASFNEGSAGAAHCDSQP